MHFFAVAGPVEVSTSSFWGDQSAFFSTHRAHLASVADPSMMVSAHFYLGYKEEERLLALQCREFWMRFKKVEFDDVERFLSV